MIRHNLLASWQESHLADAITRLTARTLETLSEDRAAKHAYPKPVEEA